MIFPTYLGKFYLCQFFNDPFADLVLKQLVASVTGLSDEGLGLVLGIGSHWSHFFIACRSRLCVESWELEKWVHGQYHWVLYGRYCRSHVGYFSHISSLCALEGGVSVEMVCCYQISAEVGLGLILGIGHICHIRHTSFWTFLHCVCRDGMLLSVLV